ncbi:hypothetical protein UM93_02430 [Psychromicrobium lacuslunae]|uniref:NlpC/P60 domain-containing protein n=2 Tax=Psychromicrobium lacuslunae TaxID=1618207 RepID=A0A0D4C2I1_9MICC|nr:hypothetical protein UM93_02430 [Psychromicrobium lacuslunae]
MSVLLIVGLIVGAFSAITVTAPTAQASDANGPIGRGEVIDRAYQRLREAPRYNQQGDSNGYRNDCSGFISMAWHLTPNGRSNPTTFSFDPIDGGSRFLGITHSIAAAELQPGDALVRDYGGTEHIALFLRWADAGHTRPVVLEHGGGNSGVEPPEQSNWGSLNGYHPIRYNRLDVKIPYGAIADKWHAAGGANSPVGNPVNDEFDSKNGGRFRDFQRGMIIWHPNVAFMVYGAIFDTYRKSGSEAKWGFPIIDEGNAQKVAEGAGAGTVGRFQKFEGALFLWSEKTGVQIVRGEIRKYFEANGMEVKLGYPASDEIAENGGFKQEFQNGTIHWTPTAGASWQAR